jgi:hypothetical protein
MKPLIAFLLASLAIYGPTLLAENAGPTGDDLPHVRCDGKRLMFGWHGGAPHRVDVSALIRADSLVFAQVLTAERDGDVDYFVVSVSGPSTGESSGTESNLIWLKLKSWKLLDSQSMLYQSFWESLEPIGDYHLKSGILTLRYSNKRESTDYVLRYDSTRPEGKIAIARASDFE